MAPARHRSSAAPLAALYAALIAYASLSPFTGWSVPAGLSLAGCDQLSRNRSVLGVLDQVEDDLLQLGAVGSHGATGLVEVDDLGDPRP